MKVVWVEWMDSRSVDTEWHDASDFPAEELMALESVGFLASEDDDRIILIASHDPHMEKFSGGMIIPKSAIVKQKTLKGK